MVLQGIEDVFYAEKNCTERDSRCTLEALDKRVAETMQAGGREISWSEEKTGDDFRAEFAKTEGVWNRHRSGLLYRSNDS